eukprot:10007488-Lingulodinium_polyedra.AAC.1
MRRPSVARAPVGRIAHLARAILGLFSAQSATAVDTSVWFAVIVSRQGLPRWRVVYPRGVFGPGD